MKKKNTVIGLLLGVTVLCLPFWLNASEIPPDTLNRLKNETSFPKTAIDKSERLTLGILAMWSLDSEGELVILEEILEAYKQNEDFKRGADFAYFDLLYFSSCLLDTTLSEESKDLVFLLIQNIKIDNTKEINKKLKKYARKDNTSEFYFRLCISYYLNSGQRKKMEPYLEKYLQLYPNSFAGNLLRASSYYKLDDWENSAAYYKKTIEISPGYAQGHYYLGECNLSLGDTLTAIKNLQAAIDLYPKDCDYINALGVVYRFRKEYNKALPLFRRITVLDSLYTFSYYNLGEIYRDLQLYDSALHYFQQVDKYDPNDDFILNLIGAQYYSMRSYKEAIYYYSRAIGLNTNKAYYYKDRGFAYYYSERFTDAIKDFRTALALDDLFYVCYIGLADSYIRDSKNYEEAIKNCDAALKIKPDYDYAMFRKAWCLLELDRTDEAIPYYKQSLELEPNNYYALENLGFIYYMREEPKECLKYSLLALELNPDDYGTMFRIAISTLLLGETQQAKRMFIQYWKEARNANYDISWVKKDLQHIINTGRYVVDARYILGKILIE